MVIWIFPMLMYIYYFMLGGTLYRPFGVWGRREYLVVLVFER